MTGEQVDAILKKIVPVVQNDPTNHVIIACLFLAIIAMNPTLTFDEMQKLIESTSQNIVFQLDLLDQAKRSTANIDLEPSLDDFTPTVIN